MKDDDEIITLISSEGDAVQVTAKVALRSITLSSLIEDLPDTSEIPVPNVPTAPLTKAMEWCKHYDNSPGEQQQNVDMLAPMRDWDTEYFENLEIDQVIHLILAANFLDIPDLLDVATRYVADTWVRGRTPEQIRVAFGIEEDFTPEEEAKVRADNSWCEEK